MEPKEFQKVIDKHKANLESLQATLDEQSAMLEHLKAEMKKLGLDTKPLLPFSELPPEAQAAYLEFERDLNSITEILAPSKVKPKGPKVRNRMTI